MAQKGDEQASVTCRRLKRCLLAKALAATFGLCLAGLAGTVSVATATQCSNEVIRTEQHALALPECRAYEIVSPPGSAPSAIYNQRVVASTDGTRFGYYSWNPYPGEEGSGLFLMSSRTENGWSTQSMVPPQGGLEEAEAFACSNPSVYYSTEMDANVLVDGFQEGEAACEGDTPPLVSGEPRGVSNLFLHNNGTGRYQLIDPWPLHEARPENAYLLDATPELEQIVFSDAAPLTLEAEVGAGEQLYEWSRGMLRLVSVLPNGAPTKAELADGPAGRADAANLTHAVSADGSRVFFVSSGNLYLRLNAMQEQSNVVGGECSEPAKACTRQVDASATGQAGGGGVFADASVDGSRVFFTDERALTANATAAPGEPDLYEYDVENRGLVDLTATTGKPADVVSYMGASEDGSYLYFVATGALAAGAVDGQRNLYLRHANRTTFIGKLSSARSGEYGESAWQVTPNGIFLAFNSVESLTGYNNTPRAVGDCVGGEPCREIFLYDASTGKLTCVSCAAPTVRPTGPAELKPPTQATFGGGPMLVSRNLVGDGIVFFNTRTPLAEQASNGVEDVYEYANGQVQLVSSPVATGDSELLEASADGHDVFFATAEALVSGDDDSADSVYDARVGGGFPMGSGEAGESCGSIETCWAPLSAAPSESTVKSSIASEEAGNFAKSTHKAGNRSKADHGGRHRKMRRKVRHAPARCRHKPKRRHGGCHRHSQRRLVFGTKWNKYVRRRRSGEVRR